MKFNTFSDFAKRYGSSTTSNRQLTKWADELKIPNFSCVMRDSLKELDKHVSPQNIIVNLQTEAEPGSDWNCLYKDGNTAYYFSSYALPPLKEIKEFTSDCSNRYYNTHSLQNTDQEYCGQMALYVLHQLNNGVSFEDAILSCR